MKKIMLVFGTRPEAIKMSPLIHELKKNKNVKCIVCVTAQHRQMLDQVLKTFNIIPDYDLDIMEAKQTLSKITSKVVVGIEEVLLREKPDIILVHGDTTTTYAAALAAFYNNVKIGHVEAGLRTYDKFSPFPEEINRQMVSLIADYHFAPTEKSKENLLKEGIKSENIYVTGNTAIDALKTTISEAYYHPILEWVGDSKLILLTAHRRENLGEPLKQMFRAVKRIVDEYEDIKVLYPIHFNPIVRDTAKDILGDSNRIRIIEPLDVVDFHNFLNKAYIILTDSGGIQEEAPSLGKPVLVMRDTTERPEGVAAGTLKLVGTNEESVYSEFKKLIEHEDEYEIMSKASNPYGDGNASIRIVNILDTD